MGASACSLSSWTAFEGWPGKHSGYRAGLETGPRSDAARPSGARDMSISRPWAMWQRTTPRRGARERGRAYAQHRPISRAEYVGLYSVPGRRTSAASARLPTADPRHHPHGIAATWVDSSSRSSPDERRRLDHAALPSLGTGRQGIASLECRREVIPKFRGRMPRRGVAAQAAIASGRTEPASRHASSIILLAGHENHENARDRAQLGNKAAEPPDGRSRAARVGRIRGLYQTAPRRTRPDQHAWRRRLADPRLRISARER